MKEPARIGSRWAEVFRVNRLRSRTRMLRPASVAGLAATVVVVGVAWYVVVDAGGRGADATDPELVALGAAVYEQHCAACHGRELEGEPNWRRRKADGTLPAPPHDATGHTWHHSDELLFRLTRDSLGVIAGEDYRTTMPAYGGILSDRDIWSVLAYIKSRWPADIQKVQAER